MLLNGILVQRRLNFCQCASKMSKMSKIHARTRGRLLDGMARIVVPPRGRGRESQQVFVVAVDALAATCVNISPTRECASLTHKTWCARQTFSPASTHEMFAYTLDSPPPSGRSNTTDTRHSGKEPELIHHFESGALTDQLADTHLATWHQMSSLFVVVTGHGREHLGLDMKPAGCLWLSTGQI